MPAQRFKSYRMTPFWVYLEWLQISLYKEKIYVYGNMAYIRHTRCIYSMWESCVRFVPTKHVCIYAIYACRKTYTHAHSHRVKWMKSKEAGPKPCQ
jgi:hypothetical protein